MRWIYLSPHADDVALSCGGLLWEQVQRSDIVEIWTICAGDPPPVSLSPFASSLHARWQTGVEASAVRRGEDRLSCADLGAGYRHFSLPDCIYRRSPENGDALYASEEAIFGNLHPEENNLVREVSREISAELPAQARLVCPLAIGGHVDHRLVCAAAGLLGRQLWYYADYPYVQKLGRVFSPEEAPLWKSRSFRVSPAGLDAWVRAVAAHASQVSTFWPDKASMRLALVDYSQGMGGVRMWRPRLS